MDMKWEIYNNDGECVNTFTNILAIALKLAEVYNCKAEKTGWIKKIYYHYKYNDKENISVYLDNGWRYEFYDIPCTNECRLDFAKMGYFIKNN